MISFAASILLVIAFLLSASEAGPLAGIAAYGVCQTGCNTVAVACYAGAGLTFGVATAGAGVPAVAIACNSALGVCMSACWAVTGAAVLTPAP